MAVATPVALMHLPSKRSMWSDLSDDSLAFAGSSPRRDALWRVSRSRSRGHFLFLQRTRPFGERLFRYQMAEPSASQGALPGYPHVEEWWRGPGFLSRFPELVRQESLGELEFSTGCPHRAFCFLEPCSSAFALGFPGEGSRKIVRAASESKRNHEACAHLSHSDEIVELFRV